jgi:hypothetical protein
VKPWSYFGPPAHLRQAHCDAIQAEYRSQMVEQRSIRHEPAPRPSIRRNPPPLPAALVPTDDPLKLRLAEELEYARRMLDATGDQLSADAGVVMRYMAVLQSFDILGQMLGHIANVIRSSDPVGAVERIGMCELKGRLKRTKIE